MRGQLNLRAGRPLRLDRPWGRWPHAATTLQPYDDQFGRVSEAQPVDGRLRSPRPRCA